MFAISLPILFLLVPIALALAGAGVYGFLWAVRNGQYEDVDTPSIRLILEDEEKPLSLPQNEGPASEKPERHESGIEGRVSSSS